jgi:hypothetical protein
MRRDRRKGFRVEWHSPGTIYDGKLARTCIVSNFSNGGAKISGVLTDTIPDEFALRITSRDDRIRRCRVRWRSDDALGIEFTDGAATSEKTARKSASHAAE